jgi:dTDP-4-dehydrorhamnose 3,5-epimerase-like enzyme
MYMLDTSIPAQLVIEPKISGDARGFFVEAALLNL